MPVATCCEGQGSRVLGSAPEYVFTTNASAPEEGFWLNLFAPATLTLNASVLEGVAPNPPPRPPPRPQQPRPLPSVAPPPPLSWEQVAAGGFHASGYNHAGSGFWSVKNVISLDECKQKCVDSTHPDNCMAITWFGSATPGPAPPPPPPPTLPCGGKATDCAMESTGHTFYTDGKYSTPITLPAAACNAKCLADPHCVQVTVGPGATRCVLYEALYSTKGQQSNAGVQAFLKCEKPAWSRRAALLDFSSSNGGGGAEENSFKYDGERVCAPHISPAQPGANGCTLFRNVDLGVAVSPAPKVTQWLLKGRRNKVEHDYILTSPQSASARTSSGTTGTGTGTVTMQVVLSTAFPYDDKVALTLRWADEKVTKVALNVRIRIPSWLRASSAVAVSINGVADGRSGKPGTYLSLGNSENGGWSNGDVISFELPRMADAALVQYPLSGIDNIKGLEGRRYALKVRPIIKI